MHRLSRRLDQLEKKVSPQNVLPDPPRVAGFSRVQSCLRYIEWLTELLTHPNTPEEQRRRIPDRIASLKVSFERLRDAEENR